MSTKSLDEFKAKWGYLETLCKRAMKLAAENPGRYGGRYVGRRWDKNTEQDVFEILEHDEPALVPADFDVIAQVTPTKVFAIGRLRQQWLNEDGSIDWSYFERKP